MSTRIPPSWAESTFSELNQFESSTTNPAQHPLEEFELYSVPTFPTGKPELLKGSAIGSSKQTVEPNDVLVCKINPRINRVWQVGDKRKFRQIASSEWIGFRSDVLNLKFYKHYFTSASFRERICTDLTGVGGSLTRAQPKRVAAFPMPVAPLKEQKRIADKLDAVLARGDACRDRLGRIPTILKRFRQSVLAAATSGLLTEDWRNTNAGVGAGIEVIALDAKAKAVMLKSDESLAKKKSSANSDIDESYTFELPDSWAFTSWGRISEWITYGFTRPMPAVTEGLKLVTAKDVLNFVLRIDSAGYTTADAFSSLSDKDRPQRGDLLITKDGTIGRAALVSTDVPFCINQSVAVCWLRSTSMNKRYLEFVANTGFTQRFVLDKSKGMAIQHLSIIDFAQCPVPVPPHKEQTEIVRRVEALFAYADRLEARYTAARTLVEKLTPATLAKAFRGELVPQDPSDEPASELLVRIKAQVSNNQKSGRKGAIKR